RNPPPPAGMKPAPQQAQERSAPRRTRRRQGKPVGPGLPRPTAVGHNPNRNPPPPAGMKPAPQKAGRQPARQQSRQNRLGTAVTQPAPRTFPLCRRSFSLGSGFTDASMPAHALHPQQDHDTTLRTLRERFRQVRATSEALCAPLAIEDYGIQGMPDASPPKWHLAHTTWFFEAFLLLPFLAGYRSPDSRYDALFNSYYLSHGQPFPRPRRGLLSRPTVAEVLNWRRVVNLALEELLDQPPAGTLDTLCRRLELGLHHEQQHQELLLMDLLYNFSLNPLAPAYRDDLPA